jgi:hypothetical protein
LEKKSKKLEISTMANQILLDCLTTFIMQVFNRSVGLC